MARPRGPSPRCSSPTSSPAAAPSGTARRTSPTRPTSRLLGEKSTSYLEDPLAAAARRRGARRPAHRGAAARPGRAGGLQLAVQHRQRPGDPARSRRGPDGVAGRGGRVGPGGDVGLAVRLPCRAAGTPTTSTPGWTAFGDAVHVHFLAELVGRRRRGRRPLRRAWASTRPSVPPGRDRVVNESSGPAPDLPVRPDARGCEGYFAASNQALSETARARPALVDPLRTDEPTASASTCSIRPSSPRIAFNEPAIEGRELDYVQASIRSGHPSSGGDVLGPRRARCWPRRPAPRRCC